MKIKILLLFTLLASILFAEAQTPQTSYVVATITQLKAYSGQANRIYVSETRTSYIISSKTADEANVYAGTSGKKWEKEVGKISVDSIPGLSSTLSTQAGVLAGKATVSQIDSALNANAFVLRNSRSTGDSNLVATGSNGFIAPKTSYTGKVKMLHSAGDTSRSITIVDVADSAATVTALAGKAATSHTHDSSTVTGLHSKAYYDGVYAAIGSSGGTSGSISYDTTQNFYYDTTSGRLVVRQGLYKRRFKALDSTGLAPTLEALNFTTKTTNFVESPAGTWADITTGDGYGVASKSLPVSTDGYIQAEYNSSLNQYTAIGLSTVSTNSSGISSAWDYQIFVHSTGQYYAQGLAFSPNTATGVTAASGDLYRLKRTGSTITAEYYRSGSWTTLHTFSATTSAQLYLKGQAQFQGGNKYLLNPKGYNIQ